MACTGGQVCGEAFLDSIPKQLHAICCRISYLYFFSFNPFPATVSIDNCVLSARLDLKTGGGQGGWPPILEARGSQYHLPPPPSHLIAAGSRLGPSTFNSFRHPRMIDRQIIDPSMGPKIFGTGRTGGNWVPKYLGPAVKGLIVN